MVRRRSWGNEANFMRSISALVDEIRTTHRAFEPASLEEIQRLKSIGMPDDVIEFYMQTNGAFLHKDCQNFFNFSEIDGTRWQWCVLSVDAIQSVADSGWSHGVSPMGDRHKQWYQIVDVFNSDYLCISLEKDHRAKIIDTFHETLNMPLHNKVVANSFTELLESLLASPDPFWLKPTENPQYF
jgi:hypothetical protein